MLNVTSSDVVRDPFPHVVSEQILDPKFYAALRADYPTADIFEEQKGDTGMTGSRTGQGFDIYRGDSTYDALIAKSEAWAEFDRWINSTAFVDKFIDVFGPYLDEMGCRAEINPSKYDRTLVEGREGMTVKPTFKERMSALTSSFRPKNSLGEVDLFTRLDIHKALKGYNKDVHCDRANRLCSFILYFVDAEKEGIEGGTLTIHKHREEKKPGDYERHPKPEDAPVVATLSPKENMGVWFPCSNNSYHGVNAMVSNGKERDYLYINISGQSETLW
ncbi:MAG: 2OG-Fe(II) oxygenase [Pseudomonadota bacterium]